MTLQERILALSKTRLGKPYFGLFEKQKPMIFKIGEGQDKKEKLKAEQMIQKQIGYQAKEKEKQLTSLSERIQKIKTASQYVKEISALPALARIGIGGAQEVYQGLMGKKVEPYRPKSEIGKYLLEMPGETKGIKPLSERVSSAMKSEFGQKLFETTGVPKKYSPLASSLGFGLLSTIEAIPGGKSAAKFGKKLLENIVKKYGDDVVETIIKKGDVKFAEAILKEGGEKVLE